MPRKSSFSERIRKTLRVSEKPTWKEIWSMFKITLLGFALVGTIGFIAQLITNWISG